MKTKLWEILSQKVADGKIDLAGAINLGGAIEDIRHIEAVKKWRTRKKEKKDARALSAVRAAIAAGDARALSVASADWAAGEAARVAGEVASAEMKPKLNENSKR